MSNRANERVGVPVAGPVEVTVDSPLQVEGRAANGVPPMGNPVWIAGWDGVDINALFVNALGQVSVFGSSFGAAFPASGFAAGFSDGTNMQGARVFDLDTGGGTELSQGVSLRISSGGGSIEAKGQKPMASSIPVVLPSDQGTNSNPIITGPTLYGSTAFGQVRVATPYTLFDGITKYNIDPLEFGTSVATLGTVTHVAAESAALLAVTAANGSRARLRTNTFHRYQAGKALRIKQTCFHADTGQANQNRFWGFYDDNDGLYWELTGTTMNIGRRSSISGAPVDTLVAQAAWNFDPMDGSGPSGVTLDITKGNIYEIELQWLGVGIVHFFINGFLVHTMNNPNTIAGPYMRTAVLPLQWEIVNTAATTASSFTEICSSVVVEGGDAPPEYGFNAFNAAAISVTTERPILSIRPAAVFPGTAIVNRILLLPKLLITSCELGRIGVRVVLNGVLTGAAFASVSADSGAEFDVAATVVTGGETVLRTFLANTNDVQQNDLEPFFSVLARKLRRNAFDTAGDILTIAAISEAAGSADVRASLQWGEVR